MITKLKHGAKGRFAALEVDKRRKERQNLVLERMSLRNEAVAVGPVAA